MLAALAVLALARPLPALAVVLAAAALWMRWDTPALAAVAGAQAVLGPAGLVQPAAGAASAWFGATALALASSGLVDNPDDGSKRRGAALATSLALGPAIAVVLAGPSLAGGPLLRILATLAGVGLAFGAAALPWRRAVAGTAVGAGAMAVGMAAVVAAQRGTIG